MTCTCARGCPESTIQRNYLWAPQVELRYRTGWYGPWGVHPSTSMFAIDPSFTTQLDNMTSYLNNEFSVWNLAINWIGCGGTYAGCDDYPYHSTARAFDLTAIALTGVSTFLIDSNQSWRDSLIHKRRYLAMICAARMFFGSGGVLGAGFDAGHQNHIHIDNWHSLNTFNLASISDRGIIRQILNCYEEPLINIDGSYLWNYIADFFLNRLLLKLKMSCTHPASSIWNTLGFLHLIVKHGIANQPAGYYTGNC